MDVSVSAASRRSKSANKSRNLKQYFTTSDLNDMARDPHRLKKFASSTEAISKSAVGFSKAAQDLKKESSKQAWAPPSKQRLFSSSSRFSDHVGPSVNEYGYLVGAAPSVGSLKEFGRAEDHIYLEDLRKLREKFVAADRDGNGTLDVNEFTSVFDKLFGLKGKNKDEILAFFNKIDYNCDGSLDWDEFCTYMYLEFKERDEAEFRSKKLDFDVPALVPCDNPHRDSLCRITHFPDGSMVSCSVDGVICVWSHNHTPKRVRRTEPGQTGKPKWVTDMALCIPQSKIMITTGDREIQFFELMNFEPYCQLRRLEAVPLKTKFWYNPDDKNDCMILVGDQDGALTVIMTTNMQEALKYWKHGPKSHDGFPTYSIERLTSEKVAGTRVFRWKLHSSWVSEIHYFPALHCFASCSSDPAASLVIGSPTGSTQVEAILQAAHRSTSMLSTSRQISAISRTISGVHPIQRPKSSLPAKNRLSGDQRVFSVPKGISTLDYSPKHNALVTGSVDQIVRIWNPFINSKPIGSLFGQGAPIFCVRVECSTNRVYSIGSDNTVMVWHILDFSCIHTVIPSVHKIYTPVEAFDLNSARHLLAIGTEHLALLKIKHSRNINFKNDVIVSHAQPLSAAVYSHTFNHIITACEGGVVKVWDILSGKNVFEFSADMDEDSGISAIDIDPSGKRVATGGQHGELKLWNYNNGHCIKSLEKGNSCEVTDIKFLTLNTNKYIIVVGWDRKISLFPDTPLTNKHVDQVVKPVEAWSTASEHAHTEDILCVAFCPPHLMATASFDGEVIVWSVISCHILARLKTSQSLLSDDAEDNITHLQDGGSIQKILFLEKRAKSRTAATLVASGPSGYIHFWNVYESARPMGRFLASQSGCVTALVVDTGNTVLISGDNDGYVGVWSIKGYCTISRATQPPKRNALWRAHAERMSCLTLVEHWNVLVTASVDGSARMWTLEGQYIGTFGQDQEWSLGDPSTYQHPLAPKDIRLNISGLQFKFSHETHKEEDEKHSGIEDHGINWVDKSTAADQSPTLDLKMPNTTSTLLEVNEIASQDSESQESDDSLSDEAVLSLEVPRFSSSNKVGNRLRHYRARSGQLRNYGLYSSLPCQSLNEVPTIDKPRSMLEFAEK